MDFSLMIRVFPVLLKAAIMTVEISVVVFVLGSIWGLILALVRTSKLRVLSTLARAYIVTFRGIPLLIVLFAIYFGMPQLGWNISAFAAGTLGLTMNLGAFTAEILRAGIQSIDKGQFEAGQSLGMSKLQAMRYIILPQALVVMIPPMSNEFINVIKDSSLFSVLTIVELTLATQRVVSSTFKPLELYILSGLMYLIMTITVERIAHSLEVKYKRE